MGPELVMVQVEATPSIPIVGALTAGVCAAPVVWGLRVAIVKILGFAMIRGLI